MLGIGDVPSTRRLIFLDSYHLILDYEGNPELEYKNQFSLTASSTTDQRVL